MPIWFAINSNHGRSERKPSHRICPTLKPTVHGTSVMNVCLETSHHQLLLLNKKLPRCNPVWHNDAILRPYNHLHSHSPHTTTKGRRILLNEPQPKLHDVDTKRRQAFCAAAERFSARCDQNEQDGLPSVNPTKRNHEDGQSHPSSVGMTSAPTRKKAKDKVPTRTHPSHTKVLLSVDAFHISNTKPRSTDHLVVDTGASHVLLRQQHMDLLTNVQMSGFGQLPFAILRAANCRILNSIGRGMLTIRTITIVAYIFRDEDLVHNLLGIALFADLGCTAVFTAKQFRFYHQKNLIHTEGHKT
jgi:hypothetical protein